MALFFSVDQGFRNLGESSFSCHHSGLGLLRAFLFIVDAAEWELEHRRPKRMRWDREH